MTPPRSVSSVRHPITLMSAVLRPVATYHFVNASAHARDQIYRSFIQISLRLIIRTKSPKERRLTVFVILSHTYSSAQSRSDCSRPCLFSLMDLPRSNMYIVASLPAMFAVRGCNGVTQRDVDAQERSEIARKCDEFVVTKRLELKHNPILKGRRDGSSWFVSAATRWSCLEVLGKRGART
jgi:hypothetical protein